MCAALRSARAYSYGILLCVRCSKLAFTKVWAALMSYMAACQWSKCCKRDCALHLYTERQVKLPARCEIRARVCVYLLHLCCWLLCFIVSRSTADPCVIGWMHARSP